MNTITIVLIQVTESFKDDFGVLSSRCSLIICGVMGIKISPKALTEAKHSIYYWVLSLNYFNSADAKSTRKGFNGAGVIGQPMSELPKLRQILWRFTNRNRA